MPSLTATLRELEQLAQADLGALRVILSEEAGVLEGPLGLPASELTALQRLDDDALGAQLRRLVHRGRQMDRQARLRSLRHQAQGAIRKLVRGAIWGADGRVHMDPPLLLGLVLADPGAKYLALHVDETVVAVPRTTLLQARRALRGFSDLNIWIDTSGLHLRWRGGKGGLNLRAREVRAVDRDRVLHIVFTPPVTKPAADNVRLPRPRGAWLGDVLAELALGL